MNSLHNVAPGKAVTWLHAAGLPGLPACRLHPHFCSLPAWPVLGVPSLSARPRPPPPPRSSPLVSTYPASDLGSSLPSAGPPIVVIVRSNLYLPGLDHHAQGGGTSHESDSLSNPTTASTGGGPLDIVLEIVSQIPNKVPHM